MGAGGRGEPEVAPELPFDTALPQPSEGLPEPPAGQHPPRQMTSSRRDDAPAALDERAPVPEAGAIVSGATGETEVVETLGGDEFEEAEPSARAPTGTTRSRK